MISFGIRNLQAISDGTIMMDDHSLTQFVGNNSNGKSILGKVIETWVSGSIKSRAARNAIIKDGCDSGTLIITHDNKMLHLIVGQENGNTICSYNPDTTSEEDLTTTRSVTEGGIDELLNAFGFRTYSNGDICLQLSPTFGAVPFITTSPKTNCEIKASICTDRVADEFLTAVEKFTWPAFKSKKTEISARIDKYEAVLKNSVYANWREFIKVKETLERCSYVLNVNPYLEIKDIRIPPMQFVDAPLLDIKPIKYFSYTEHFNLPPITKSLSDLTEIINGVCPTCGKRLLEDSHEH